MAKRKPLLVNGAWIVALGLGVSFGSRPANATEKEEYSAPVLSEEKAPEAASVASEGIRTERVLLRCLDKITARVSDIEATVGKAVKFGTLEMTARFCQKSLPEDPPEAVAFLEISEHKPGEKVSPVFSGWMFASSPAASAMEHPVYDVWVKNCTGKTLEGQPIPLSSLHSPSPPASLSSSVKAFRRGFGEKKR